MKRVEHSEHLPFRHNVQPTTGSCVLTLRNLKIDVGRDVRVMFVERLGCDTLDIVSGLFSTCELSNSCPQILTACLSVDLA